MPSIGGLVREIENTSKTLFILCGFPYAGKSYVAKQLLEQTHMVLVSIDEVFYGHGFDWDSSVLPDAKAWEQIFDESYEQVKKNLMDGKNVLYDSTNQTVTSRNQLREIANSVGADAKVIYIKSSEASVWERWEDNQRNPHRSIVSRELVQQTIDMFEEPIEKEDAFVIENS